MNLYLLFCDATIWGKLEVILNHSSQHNISVQPNVVTVIHVIKSHYVSIIIPVYLRQILLQDDILLQ